ncbi:uncharacterized protein ColSpa_09601 [Colletotrichum spaethianum]|uniref:Uncharacterized protein n=1 Tax=Colletotrichum spaethianum TaxID=700344 RepID=A0AA37PC29_9PEZI|nr:uncharacterized protein ColSpa_09601 [Colletotrichum spaethianum]GKT49420.1 hypothetical protein ColSpa_09601 [Colletotrichum spaethianum]
MPGALRRLLGGEGRSGPNHDTDNGKLSCALWLTTTRQPLLASARWDDARECGPAQSKLRPAWWPGRESRWCGVVWCGVSSWNPQRCAWAFQASRLLQLALLGGSARCGNSVLTGASRCHQPSLESPQLNVCCGKARTLQPMLSNSILHARPFLLLAATRASVSAGPLISISRLRLCSHDNAPGGLD